MDLTTGKEYTYTTGKKEKRRVILAAINVTQQKGQIEFIPSGHKMWVKLSSLSPAMSSTENKKNDKETSMATTKSNGTKSTGTGTRRRTTAKTTKAAPKADAPQADAPQADTPALPPLPPVTDTPATVTPDTIKVPGLDREIPNDGTFGSVVTIPPQSPAPTPEFSAANPAAPTNDSKETNTRKETDMPKTNTPTTIPDPLSFFKPVEMTFEICDMHRDGGYDEILRDGESFHVPGSPIPHGPMITACADTVWDAIDDVRRFWTLMRMSAEFLDQWITDQGETLPERRADEDQADEDGEEFAEYAHGEGQDDEDDDESAGAAPALPSLPPVTPVAPAPAAPSLAAVQTDLGATATLTTAPQVKATGGGQKGQATPGPSRIPRQLKPQAQASAKAFAIAHGYRNSKGEPITEDSKGKLPGTALKAWLESNPSVHEAYVATWEAK